jgi:hypothetical protein
MLKLIDTDRRYRRDHSATGHAVRQRLRRDSKHEPAPAESDAERREGTEGGALQELLQRPQRPVLRAQVTEMSGYF